jgi:hypothetical protein
MSLPIVFPHWMCVDYRQIPWLLLSLIGVGSLAHLFPILLFSYWTAALQGVLGSLLIKLNIFIALYRHRSFLRYWPVLEVVCAAAITGAVSYLVCKLDEHPTSR